MTLSRVKKDFRAVNSKSLVAEIDDFIAEGLENLGISWSSESQRSTFVELVEQFMEEFQEDKKIQQYKVMCDFRNNKLSNMNKGVYQFDVHFKQKNCLNVTKLLYTLNTSTGLQSLQLDIAF